MKSKLLLLLVLVQVTCSLFAQTGKQITGIVTDGKDVLPGVSVVVKGTTNGTITGLDGDFTINKVKSSDILVFSYIGYKTQEIKANLNSKLKVILKEDAQALGEVEVVAVGYGDVRRRDLTGSVAKANIGDLIKTPSNNVAETLGGRIAGVQVTSSDGGLDDNFNITIRGAGSLTQSTSPLYVIDGFPQEDSGLSAINPNDIESLDVLKDASATAIYGARGANGVVIITTKKGVAGKPTVSYSGSVTVSNVKNLPELMNGYEFVQLQQEILAPDDFAKYYLSNGITLDDYRTFKSYDWQDEIFRTALSHNHNVNLSGQSGKTRYSTSLSFNDKEGVIINSDLKKYQGRIKLQQDLSDKIKFDASANFSSNVQNGPNPSATTWAATNSWMYSVWAYRPVSPSGSDLLSEMYDEDIMDPSDYRFNPILSAKNEYRKKTTNTLQANASLEFEPVKNLKLKIMGGYSSMDYKNEEFNGSKTKTGNTNPSNTLSRGINAKLSENSTRSYLNENTLSYVFNRDKHNFNALLGISLQSSNAYAHSITAEYISNESFGMAGLDKGSATPYVTSSKGENNMMSYFGRVNYNFDSKYYINFTMRADGSSKFAKDNRWGYFPSGSLAWSFAREKFIKDAIPFLSNGKLRASYGLTGNNRIGNYDYMAHLEMLDAPNEVSFYPFNSIKESGYLLRSLANSKLKWETTEQLDFGLDFGLFNDRVNATVDYYIKTTKDLLLNAEISASSGYQSGMMNIGKIQNRGIELTLETVNIKNKNFTWTSNFNIAFNSNKVKALNYGQNQMTSFVKWDTNYDNMAAYVSRIGDSAGKLYGFVYDGTYKVDDFNVTTNADGTNSYKLKDGIPYYSSVCQPGDPKYKNLSGDDLIINDADKTIIGNGQPLHTGGFTNNFTYKNWDLNVFMQWSYGNDIWNVNRLCFENPGGKKNTNMYSSYVDRWTFDNQSSNIPRAKAVGSNVYSSLYVEDGSFLKLKNITLGYTLPKDLLKKISISNLRVYVSAENIYTLTNYSGIDPEVSTRQSVLTPGFDWSPYPRAFNASFGLNLTF